MPTYDEDEDESIGVMEDDPPTVRRAVTKRAVRKTAARRVRRTDDDEVGEELGGRDAFAKPNPEHLSIPNDAAHPNFLSVVHERARDAVTKAMSGVETGLLSSLIEIIQIKIEHSYNNPAYLGFSTEFNPEHFRVGIIGGRTLSLRELTRQQMRSQSWTTKNERNWHTLFGDNVLPETYTPDEPLDLRNGRYPSARHLYFALETLCACEGWGSDGNAASFKFHLDRPSCDYELTVAQLADSVIMMFNDSGWTHRTRFDLSRKDSLRYRNHVSYEHREFAHLDVMFSTVDPTVVVPITVEQLVECGVDELVEYITSTLDARRNNAFQRGTGSARDPDMVLRFVTGLYIEGVHWNKHRRSEIEHLIVESPNTLMQELGDWVESTESYDPYTFHDIDHSLSCGFEEMSPLLFGRLQEPAAGVLLDGKYLLCPTQLDAHMLVRAVAEATKPSPEKIRELAIKQAVAHLDATYKEKLEKAYTCRQRLIDAELAVARAYEERKAFARSLDGAIDVMTEMFKSMDIFIDVQMSPAMTYLLTTGDIYGTYPVIEDDDGEDAGRRAFAKRRYVGQYQIVYEPITGAMKVRNIAAPMALASRQPEYKHTEFACAAFHPHSSIEGNYEYTSVCLSSYGSEIGKTLRRQGGSIADVAFNQIRNALLFLQTYSIHDSFVTSLLSAMPETRPDPKFLGVTSWQDFCRGDKRIMDFSCFDFKNYPSPTAKATMLRIDPAEYRWPDILKRNKADTLVCPILQFVNFDNDSVESVGLHQMLLKSDPEVAAAIERHEAAKVKKQKPMLSKSVKKSSQWTVVQAIQANAVAQRRSRNAVEVFEQAVAAAAADSALDPAEVSEEGSSVVATVTLGSPAFTAYSNNESEDDFSCEEEEEEDEVPPISSRTASSFSRRVVDEEEEDDDADDSDEDEE